MHRLIARTSAAVVSAGYVPPATKIARLAPCPVLILRRPR